MTSSYFSSTQYPQPGSARLSHPLVLCILDGWGLGDPHNPYNAIHAAHTPVWDALTAHYPLTQLDASGTQVGLPENQMGNSEVGHLTMGAGRTVLQKLPMISEALEKNTLPTNPVFQNFLHTLKSTRGTCHLMGLFSDGGVHSHLFHLKKLIEAIHAHEIPIYLHCFLDGRDTPTQSALSFYQKFLESLPRTSPKSFIKVATLCGRFYAMDRDNRWERTQKAYNLIINGQGHSIETFSEGIAEAYKQGLTDETVPPCVIKGYPGIKPADGLLCFNFRADRVRQLMGSFLDPTFKAFSRSHFPLFSIGCGIASYSKELDLWMGTLFPRQKPTSPFGTVLSTHHLSQLRLAETEKFAHVTYFFNGGEEKPFPEEYRLLIPSPQVEDYAHTPEMSSETITTCLIQALQEKRFDVIIVNYANPDMIGHTGDFMATQHAIAYLDHCLGKVWKAVKETNSILVITADHGNAEEMRDEEGIHVKTSHSHNPVPFLIANAPFSVQLTHEAHASLRDIAPTLLSLLKLPIPEVMTGSSLIKNSKT